MPLTQNNQLADIDLLIVEDEPVTRTLLAEIFTGAGYRVRSAEDGFSALEKIREAVPDVLLSDLHMPGMSGFELLSVVRRRLPSIYVIATSGAYRGKGVPPGVAADAFYEKATGAQSLLDLMDIAGQRRPTVRAVSTRAPIWISRDEARSSGANSAILSCPECMRSFAALVGDEKQLMRTVECVYCGTTIQYALVEQLDPVTSQPYVPQAMRAGPLPHRVSPTVPQHKGPLTATAARLEAASQG